MKIGFTGTQIGMSSRQKTMLRELLVSLHTTEFHHGDCIGADAEAHEIASLLNLRIIIHPPRNSSKRANCPSDTILPPLDYLERNHAIVDATEILIAAPKTNTEELRSGTWATVRYALRVGKHRHLLTR